VPEAHQALAAVEQLLDVALGVAAPGDLVEHLEHARGSASVEGPRERADSRRHRRSAVGSRRRDDARRERRRVRAVLRRRDPIAVDRAHVTLVGLAAPAQEEAFGRRLALGDAVIGHPRLPAARGLSDEREHRRREAGEIVARLLVVDVDQLAEPPPTGKSRRGAL
jgi:hypothetical protein